MPSSSGAIGTASSGRTLPMPSSSGSIGTTSSGRTLRNLRHLDPGPRPPAWDRRAVACDPCLIHLAIPSLVSAPMDRRQASSLRVETLTDDQSRTSQSPSKSTARAVRTNAARTAGSDVARRPTKGARGDARVEAGGRVVGAAPCYDQDVSTPVQRHIPHNPGRLSAGRPSASRWPIVTSAAATASYSTERTARTCGTWVACSGTSARVAGRSFSMSNWYPPEAVDGDIQRGSAVGDHRDASVGHGKHRAARWRGVLQFLARLENVGELRATSVRCAERMACESVAARRRGVAPPPASERGPKRTARPSPTVA